MKSCSVQWSALLEITRTKLIFMEGFFRADKARFSGEGKSLRDMIILSLTFYKSVSTSDAALVATTRTGYILRVDIFLDNFIRHYTKNEQFRDSLVVNLMKGYVSKVNAIKNPQYGTNFSWL